jgi:hypothetical protein
MFMKLSSCDISIPSTIHSRASHDSPRWLECKVDGSTLQPITLALWPTIGPRIAYGQDDQSRTLSEPVVIRLAAPRGPRALR